MEVDDRPTPLLATVHDRLISVLATVNTRPIPLLDAVHGGPKLEIGGIVESDRLVGI